MSAAERARKYRLLQQQQNSSSCDDDEGDISIFDVEFLLINFFKRAISVTFLTSFFVI